MTREIEFGTLAYFKELQRLRWHGVVKHFDLCIGCLVENADGGYTHTHGNKCLACVKWCRPGTDELVCFRAHPPAAGLGSVRLEVSLFEDTGEAVSELWKVLRDYGNRA